MSARRALHWLMWGGVALGVALLLIFGLRFPWRTTLATLAGVDLVVLAAALLVNLLSPVAKGWSWHLLLAPVAPNRWWSTQQANLLGTAVNSVAAGVSGEAARIVLIGKLDRVPTRAAVLSVMWTRTVEAIGLALFLVVAPFAVQLPPVFRGLQIGAAVALVTVLAMTRLRVWQGLVWRLPQWAREPAREFAAIGWGPRLIGPSLLALCNWLAQWATYHLTLHAAHLEVTWGASLTALIAVNLGGLVRVTPANVGVVQAAMVGALIPFGIAAENAVAAGVLLQAIQVLPILALALGVFGWAGSRQLVADATEVTAE